MVGFKVLVFLADYVRSLFKQRPPIDPADYGINSMVLGFFLRKISDFYNFLLVVSIIPVIGLVFDIGFHNLGSNPIQAFHVFTGTWCLRFLCLTLLVTPVQKVTGWRGLANFRQLLGLLTFFYGALHVYGYVALDHAGEWRVIAADISDTAYLWYGVFCFVILTLLALTSFKAAKKILGKNWKKLHQWIYPASLAAVLHYYMQLKGDLVEPLTYAIIIILLLAARILARWKDRRMGRMMIPKRPTLLDV